jgi:hypothetical protein
MKIAIWNETSPKAGCRVEDNIAVEYRDPAWTVYKGDWASLQRQAAQLEEQARDAEPGHAAFLRKSCDSIRAFVKRESGGAA